MTPETTIKGEYTFPMLLQEDHSYHLYGLDEDGHINLHGLSFEPAFVMNENDKVATEKGSAFLNGYKNVPSLTVQQWSDVTYESADDAYATVTSKLGEVTPKKYTASLPNGWVDIRAKVTSSIKSKSDNEIFKYPSYHLVIADIPMYRLGDDKRKDLNGRVPGISDTNAKDGFSSNGAIYAPTPGDSVSTYNILTPIRMTYGGWTNKYKKNATSEDLIQDSYEPKTNAEIGGSTANDTQFNKYIDGYTWSNVAKQNPTDENFSGDYKNYLTGTTHIGKTHYKNTFSLPAHGAYWRFEPRTNGTVFVYLVQNGVCSYTGNSSSLVNTDKHYFGLDWKPLYIVDESGANVQANMEMSNTKIKEFFSDADAYTLGVIRCDKTDGDVWAANPNDGFGKGSRKEEADLNKFSFSWEYTDKNSKPAGFNVDYKDIDNGNANREALKTKILDAWDNIGDTEDIIQDDLSHGYTLLSKAYVRYAIPVKAGKSYWVFQNGSKPNFCGFAFIPNDFDGTQESVLEKATNTPLVISDDPANDKLSTADANTIYDVTYQDRTFKNRQWLSLCLPFSVSEYEFHRVFGADAKIVTFDNLNDAKNNIHFVQHNYRMMEAGRPYFVYPDWGEGVDQQATLEFKAVTIEGKNDANDHSANSEELTRIIEDKGLYFVGSYTGETMPQYSYCLSAKDGSLKRVTKDTSIKSYRGYLKNPTSDESLAHIGIVNYEEPYEDVAAEEQPEPTTIVGVSDANAYDVVDGSALKNGIYTLEGQLVSMNSKDVKNLPAGAYIVNGKKKVVK